MFDIHFILFFIFWGSGLGSGPGPGSGSRSKFGRYFVRSGLVKLNLHFFIFLFFGVWGRGEGQGRGQGMGQLGLLCCQGYVRWGKVLKILFPFFLGSSCGTGSHCHSSYRVHPRALVMNSVPLNLSFWETLHNIRIALSQVVTEKHAGCTLAVVNKVPQWERQVNWNVRIFRWRANWAPCAKYQPDRSSGLDLYRGTDGQTDRDWILYI